METVVFASFGEIFVRKILGRCAETNSPIVEFKGKLYAVSKIQIETAKILISNN
jgi:hypothetical protein